ncbi:unnamed protein product [Dibothriocephalus latus]|uniref:Amino acid transporter n=1 Tax=Dibothriocephalus latus TaxID=60516 RepID=A0A3P6UF00_DIBLA|nr:unnamed protein product [Dibothriocephalus latus]
MSETSEAKSETKAPQTCCQKFAKCQRDNLFTILTLIGVAVGFGIGFGVGSTGPTEVTIEWIIMAGMDPKENGKMGGAAVGFIVGMDILSGVIGVITAYLIAPGTRVVAPGTAPPQENTNPMEAPVTTSDVFADLFLNIFPDNVVGIAIFQTKTTREYTNPAKNETRRIIGNLFATDMIGLIFTSIVFGIAAGKCGETGRVFVEWFQSLGDVVLIIMRWFLTITPIGVCFMIAGAVVGLEDVGGTFKSLLLFMATVLVALAVHMIIQMIIYAIASFRNPFMILIKGFKVLICIPDMIEMCDKYGLQKKITRFVIPLSAALKGDGSGAFQAVACVFIAQLSKVDINVGTYVIIALLTGFATLAIPNVPSSSIIIIITILSSLGVPTDQVSLLFAVEWIMDRCRSGSIGLGHLFAAAFTHSVAVGRRTEHQDDAKDDEESGKHISDDEATYSE